MKRPMRGSILGILRGMDQVNPFPTMIIGPRGRAIGRLGGVERILEPGRMVFIPPGVVHEAWNPFDEPAGFIVLMFGEGA